MPVLMIILVCALLIRLGGEIVITILLIDKPRKPIKSNQAAGAVIADLAFISALLLALGLSHG